jgi:hypothetical protein
MRSRQRPRENGCGSGQYREFKAERRLLRGVSAASGERRQRPVQGIEGGEAAAARGVGGLGITVAAEHLRRRWGSCGGGGRQRNPSFL